MPILGGVFQVKCDYLDSVCCFEAPLFLPGLGGVLEPTPDDSRVATDELVAQRPVWLLSLNSSIFLLFTKHVLLLLVGDRSAFGHIKSCLGEIPHFEIDIR